METATGVWLFPCAKWTWWLSHYLIIQEGICRLYDMEAFRAPGPWFNIKMPSNQYRKSHCGDKTVVRSSYLHNGISYTCKMTSLYWISPQDTYLLSYVIWWRIHCRVDSRVVPSQWEMILLCNDFSHWLGASLESAVHCGNKYGANTVWHTISQISYSRKKTLIIIISLRTFQFEA